MSDPLLVVCPHCEAINRVPHAKLRDHGKCGVCHRALFEGRPLAITDAGRFDRQAAKGDIPLLVDFWATWCGPCRTMAPIFEKAALELEPDFRLVKVDTDAVRELSERFVIHSIPTLMIVHHGREVARTAGVMQLPQLVAWARQNAGAVKV